MQPLISIIIPVYNRQSQVIQALASIGAQTYEHIEVIIVDDGSDIPIEASVEDIGRDIPFQLVRQKNAGAPVARNVGFELSKGKFVIFWDDDVIGEPDMLEQMYDTLVAHEDAGYAYCPFYFGKKLMRSRSFDIEALKEQNYITTTSLIRREAFPEFDERLTRFQDWDLWLTMLDNGYEGVFVDHVLFRVIPGGTMSSWLPSCAYKAPLKWLPGIKRKVKKYEAAKRIIKKKHGI